MISKNIKILSISDIHFNPCYDSSIVKRLENSDTKDWEDIFKSSSIEVPSTYGSDTNYPLLKSFLKHINSIDNIGFVMFSGDFLGHDLRDSYEKSTSDNTMSGFESFITKTFRFIVMMFKKYLPEITIYPALGNDDSYNGDYNIEADGDFLKMVHKEFKPIFELPDTFKKGGYYAASIPQLQNNRLIVLNNTFMSTRYPDNSQVDEGQIQLNWLKDELKSCRSKNVWLMFHEPLGINIYPTVKKGDYDNPEDIDIFLKDNYYSQLISELKSYGTNINILFSGHTHMDSFRILHDKENKPVLYNHITPAVSPLFGNNPAFQIFTIDVKSNNAVDMTTVTLNQGSKNIYWENEYNFNKEYDVADMTPGTLFEVWKKIGDSESFKNRYMTQYFAGSMSISEKNWSVYYETMSEMGKTDFAEQFKKQKVEQHS